MSEQKLYAGFLGHWQLEPDQCEFEQSVAPVSGSYGIEEGEKGLVFTMAWVDAEGHDFVVTFKGQPDGQPHPFNGGDLADALAVTAVSADELKTSAFLKGHELMVATRRLSGNGQFMRLTQTVHLPDGTSPSNHSRYKRAD